MVFGGRDCPSQPLSPCRVDSGTPIVVNGGPGAITADFSLSPAASITGHVIDAVDRNGVASLQVAAYLGSTFVESTTTDASGAYQLTGLDPGNYVVRTMAD